MEIRPGQWVEVLIDRKEDGAIAVSAVNKATDRIMVDTLWIVPGGLREARIVVDQCGELKMEVS